MLSTHLRRNISKSTIAHIRLRSFCSSSEKTENASSNSSSKEIGNPITWANPNNGPSQDDRSSNAWKWVYPAGLGFILMASLISRYRNKKEKGADASKMKLDRSIRMQHAMERLDFATKSEEQKKRVSSSSQEQYYDEDY